MDISLTDTGADGPVHGPGDTRLGQGVWLGQKKARESGRGVGGPCWDHEVGARLRGSLCPGKHMNWPWTAVLGRKAAQIGNCFWQGSPLRAQRRYNDLSTLRRLQTFTDGVVLQRQGSNAKPVWLVRAGLAAGAITNLPCESGSPVSTPSVQGRAGGHIQHGHLIVTTCTRDWS